jgi:hypothetical protein
MICHTSIAGLEKWAVENMKNLGDGLAYALQTVFKLKQFDFQFPRFVFFTFTFFLKQKCKVLSARIYATNMYCGSKFYVDNTLYILVLCGVNL